MNKTSKAVEPTKKDVSDFVEEELYNLWAYGLSHKNYMVEGIMALLERQHKYDIASPEARIKKKTK